MARDQLLDLAHADLLALADDDVLQPAGDAQVAAASTPAEVAGAEPAVGGEGVGVERGVGVADEALRAARLHLAFGAGRQQRAVGVATMRSSPGAMARPSVSTPIAAASAASVVVMVGNSVEP